MFAWRGGLHSFDHFLSRNFLLGSFKEENLVFFFFGDDFDEKIIDICIIVHDNLALLVVVFSAEPRDKFFIEHNFFGGEWVIKHHLLEKISICYNAFIR